MERKRGLEDTRALEAVIAEEPFDDTRWQVLEDFLLERGDPRASLVRAEQGGVRAEIDHAYQRLARTLLGRRAEKLRQLYGVTDWRAGYARKLDLRTEIPRARLDDLLSTPAARLVREVRLQGSPPGAPPDWLGTALAPLHACVRSLRRLRVEATCWSPPTSRRSRSTSCTSTRCTSPSSRRVPRSRPCAR